MWLWGELAGVYCGPPPLQSELWTRWNVDPALIAALALAAFALRRDRRALAGLAVLAVAFVSPLCALSAALFSARVVHHVLLVAVAAPLLARAWPARAAGAPGLALAAATATLWFWHLPPAYDAALSHMGVYWIMQVSLVATAMWFWRAAFSLRGRPVDVLLCIGAAFAQMGLLGALLAFAPQPLYAAHLAAPLDWGLTPLADQQLGGLVMWVPAGVPYAVAAIVAARRDWNALRRGPA